MESCACCKKADLKYVCAGCGSVYYCSEKCQRKHFNKHAPQCKQYWTELSNVDAATVTALEVSSPITAFDIILFELLPHAQPSSRYHCCIGCNSSLSDPPPLPNLAVNIGCSRAVLIRNSDRCALRILDKTLNASLLPIDGSCNGPIQNWHGQCLLYYLYWIQRKRLQLRFSILGENGESYSHIALNFSCLPQQLQDGMNKLYGGSWQSSIECNARHPPAPALTLWSELQPLVASVYEHRHWLIAAEFLLVSTRRTIYVSNTIKTLDYGSHIKLRLEVGCNDNIPSNASHILIFIYSGSIARVRTLCEPRLLPAAQECKPFSSYKIATATLYGEFFYESSPHFEVALSLIPPKQGSPMVLKGICLRICCTSIKAQLQGS